MHALILAPFSARYLARLRRDIEVSYESWLDTNRLQDPDELAQRIVGERVDVLVVEADFVFEEIFEGAPNLRMVGVCRNALNQIDVDSATEHGVAVTHAPGRNTAAVAEMTLGLMLALARRIPQAHGTIAGAGWRDPSLGYRRFRGREIGGADVGVIGFGQIGRAVARLCIALGARVRAYDPFVPERQMRAIGVAQATLEEIARKSDFVTLHVADTPETHGMIDDGFLGRMRPGAFVVNTSTGAAIDTAALVAALESGALGGAALDVFEGQPLPVSSPLMAAPNLLMTPHVGGATMETVERHSRMLSGEIERLRTGKPLRYVVNPDYVLVQRGS